MGLIMFLDIEYEYTLKNGDKVWVYGSGDVYEPEEPFEWYKVLNDDFSIDPEEAPELLEQAKLELEQIRVHTMNALVDLYISQH